MVRNLLLIISLFFLPFARAIGQPGLSTDTDHFSLADSLPKNKNTRNRVYLVTAINVAGYGGTMLGLYNAWYKNYPQTHFHFFNDLPEWNQVDKTGHLFSAYQESRASTGSWRWTGISRKNYTWIGGMSGAFYQTVIEVLDGFSAGWGWSWGDFGANILGSGSFVSQELLWKEQRLQFKFSAHRRSYGDDELNLRSNDLFGSSFAERSLKDYNGQTYWASANLRSFFPRSSLPQWLNLSIGYGAEGLFGGRQNYALDENGAVKFDRRDIKRTRQWYLAPDIDLTRIKTRSKTIKTILSLLNAVKCPMPAMELSNGKLRFHGLYF